MEDIYRSQFRLPYPLYEQLKASADANHRSVNAELVARLEQSFQHESQPSKMAEKALALSGEKQPSEEAKALAKRISKEELEALLTVILQIK